MRSHTHKQRPVVSCVFCSSVKPFLTSYSSQLKVHLWLGCIQLHQTNTGHSKRSDKCSPLLLGFKADAVQMGSTWLRTSWAAVTVDLVKLENTNYLTSPLFCISSCYRTTEWVDNILTVFLILCCDIDILYLIHIIHRYPCILYINIYQYSYFFVKKIFIDKITRQGCLFLTYQAC